MRSCFLVRSLFLAAFLVPLALLASSCSSTDGTTPSADNEGGAVAAGSSPDGGGGDGASGGDGARPPPNDCKLAELTGVGNVTPTFVTYEPPGTAPPTMTGGPLSGSYRVDKATVFLPTQTKGLADPKKSTGTVNAWAVFSGKDYRLFLKSNLVVASAIGPQPQDAEVASQGAFAVNAASLTLDHACNVAPPKPADYSFTDDGSGRATILVKMGTTYGDTYLLLDAAKN